MVTSSPDTISFSCQHCATPLTIPSELAGVTGPCPFCGNEITAPSFVAPMSHMAAPQAAPSQPYYEQPPAYQAQAPAPAYYNPPAQHSAPPQTYQQPQPYEQPVYTQHPAAHSAYSNQAPQQPAYTPPITPPETSHYQAPTQESRQEYSVPEERTRYPKSLPKERRSFAKPLILAGLVGTALVGAVLAGPKILNAISPSTASADPATATAANARPALSEIPEYTPPAASEPEEIDPTTGHLVTGSAPSLLEDEASPDTLDKWDDLATSEVTSDADDSSNILSAPRKFLESYLTAATWMELVDRSIDGKSLQTKMASYYQANPYKPETITEINFEHTQKLAEHSDRHFYLFKVVTESNPGSFPMTVEETADGLRTDWVTYVQFKDMHLQKFLETRKLGESQQFHVILRKAHYFLDDVPDVDKKSVFEVTAPIDGFEGGYVFLPDFNNYAKELKETLKWGYTYFPIVELKWDADTNSPNKPYVKLVKIIQYNWRGHDPDSDKNLPNKVTSS